MVLGASIGGMFIDAAGVPGVIWCGLIFAALSMVVIVAKVVMLGARAHRRPAMVPLGS